MIAAARSAAERRDAHPAQARISDTEWQAITTLLERLRRACAPLEALVAGAPLQNWLAAHRAALVEVMRDAEGKVIAAGEDFETLQLLFEELAASSDLGIDFSADDYRAFFDLVVKDTIVRGPQRSHPRLKILGLLEARLLGADVMLLGGLDEGVWPPQAATDAFLNRPMRAELGLTPPERRIGQTAHDFVMAMGNPFVVVSRAKKRDGTPTVPSRFLQRLAALAGEPAWQTCRARGDRLLAFARALDRPPDHRRGAASHAAPTCRVASDVAQRHAHRDLAPRPLRDLCRAHIASPATRRSRMPNAARARPAPSLHEVLAEFTSTRPSGELPENSFENLVLRAEGDIRRLSRQCRFPRLSMAAHRSGPRGIPRMGAGTAQVSSTRSSSRRAGAWRFHFQTAPSSL